MRRISAIVLLLCVLLLTGCADKKRSDSLTDTLTAYAATLRWDDFRTATQFIDPKLLIEHPLSALDMDRYQQVKVTEYDEGAGPAPLGEFEVQQTVRISLVNIHTQAERSVIDHQIWRYDQKRKHWWLISGLPDISRE